MLWFLPVLVVVPACAREVWLDDLTEPDIDLASLDRPAVVAPVSVPEEFDLMSQGCKPTLLSCYTKTCMWPSDMKLWLDPDVAATACHLHMCCYSNCQCSQSHCDKQMLGRLYALCDNTYPGWFWAAKRAVCRLGAKDYVKAGDRDLRRAYNLYQTFANHPTSNPYSCSGPWTCEAKKHCTGKTIGDYNVSSAAQCLIKCQLTKACNCVTWGLKTNGGWKNLAGDCRLETGSTLIPSKVAKEGCLPQRWNCKNHHVVTGRIIRDVTTKPMTLENCQYICSQDPSCKGVTWGLKWVGKVKGAKSNCRLETGSSLKSSNLAQVGCVRV